MRGRSTHTNRRCGRNPVSAGSKRRSSGMGVKRPFGVTLLVLALVLSPRAGAAEFEVGAGYLSASVREIVEGYGWSLVWAADEDRIIDHPFTVDNGSLPEALTAVLAIYRGQLVADLYQGNRVVLVDAAPPRVRVLLPGERPDVSENELGVVDPGPLAGKAPAAAALAEAAQQGRAVSDEAPALAARTDSGVPATSDIELAERQGDAASGD